MKLNHFICPNCGHDFYADAAYATCDACQLCFYAAQSLTRTEPVVLKKTTATGGGYYLNGQWIQTVFR